MKTTSIAAAVLCLLTACGSEESSHTSSACDGGGGLATSTTGAGGVGGHGNTMPAGGSGGGACSCDCEPTAPSTHPLAYCEDPAHDGSPCCRDGGTVGECSAGGCAPQACPDPSLGYDPTTAPIGPLIATEADVGGIVAAVLEPFAATTTCQTVVIGFATGPAPCEVPSAIEVVTFDTALPSLPEGASITSIATLAGKPLFPTSTPGIVEARFHLQTSHVAGLYPFVGAIVRPNFCPAVMPLCGPDSAPAMRYRSQPPWKGWSKLADPLPGLPAGGTFGALYFGLADCGAQ